MSHSPHKIKALLIGINAYPIRSHRLKGCIADLKSLKEFLEESKTKIGLPIIVNSLTDKKASRENIIDTFLAYFNDLQDGDTALFYFSGHGSTSEAPQEFWHLASNRKHETLVCYDSRLEGGFDLLDKELSWLIWKVTQKKKVKFIVILDCCHSGSGTRIPLEEKSQSIGIREVKDIAPCKSWKNYLGSKDFILKNEQINIPVGRHILLSACSKDEFAKEKIIGHKTRGVFTYGLVKVLRMSMGNLSLQQVIKASQAYVYNHSNNQHPQIEATHSEEVKLSIFGSQLKRNYKPYLIYHHPKKGWILALGSLQGLQKENKEQQQKFDLSPAESGDKSVMSVTEAVIDSIYPTFSTLTGLEKVDQNKQFWASPSHSFISKMKIAISPHSEIEGIKCFQSEWESASSLFLETTENIAEAEYEIKADNGYYSIASRSEPFYLSPTFHSYNSHTANQVLKSLEKIAQWRQVKSISNPISNIQKEELDFEFFQVEKASPDFLQVIEEHQIIDFTSVDLAYSANSIPGNKAKFIEPMFRLKIKNPKRNRRKLWYSVLFLGTDFSIDNDLLPIEALAPGEESWLKAYDSEHQVFTTLIPLHIETIYQKVKIYSITEYFKIIICTEEFETFSLIQEGVLDTSPFDEIQRGKGRKPSLQFPTADWTVVDFSVNITLPTSP